MAQQKMNLSELASEYGWLTGNDLILLCRELGVPAKSPATSFDATVIELLRTTIEEDGFAAILPRTVEVLAAELGIDVDFCRQILEGLDADLHSPSQLVRGRDILFARQCVQDPQSSLQDVLDRTGLTYDTYVSLMAREAWATDTDRPSFLDDQATEAVPVPPERVYDLARELGLTIDDCLALCATAGVPAQSHRSKLSPSEADRVRDAFRSPTSTAPTADTSDVAAPTVPPGHAPDVPATVVAPLDEQKPERPAAPTQPTTSPPAPAKAAEVRPKPRAESANADTRTKPSRRRVNPKSAEPKRNRGTGKTGRLLVVDGSNLATEGRRRPSVAQLREAVASLTSTYADAELAVIVDATFPRRINEAERDEFERLVLAGSVLCPPAGWPGRGDAFICDVASRALSRGREVCVATNDSYRELQDVHSWLNDPERVIGGKYVRQLNEWVWGYRNLVKNTPPRSR